MSHSYEVRIYKTEERGQKPNVSYRQRWKVGGILHRRTFRTFALADSFRSELVAAARRGEAFDVETGAPASKVRDEPRVDWIEFAIEYVDVTWGDSAAKSRRNRAQTLTDITVTLLRKAQSPPNEESLRRGLTRWTFNKLRRAQDPPSDVSEALKWAAANSPPVDVLARTDVVRAVLESLASKRDGTLAAASYFNRRRMVLSHIINYAIEREQLTTNPLKTVKLNRARYAKTITVVDRSIVVNPNQARALLDAVRTIQRSGPRLVAFFGLLYYAALRPEEAVELGVGDLSLPPTGWGEITLSEVAPDVGGIWTDSGETRDRRGLKHRADGETRTVPCPPELTALLHDHLKSFGHGRDGRLFWGERGDALGSTYKHVWHKARREVLGKAAATSSLARRPYDLRHAAVSTWLNAGVPAAQVAQWAGHSVAVLLRVYAKCIDGQEHEARKRIEDALQADAEAPEADPQVESDQGPSNDGDG